MREAKMARKVARLAEARELAQICPVCGGWVGKDGDRHLRKLKCLYVDERQSLRDDLYDKLGSWKAVARWFLERQH